MGSSLSKKLRQDKLNADPSQYWGEEFGLNIQNMRRGKSAQRRKRTKSIFS